MNGSPRWRSTRGELLLAATDAGRIQLWQAQSREHVATLQQPAPKSGDFSYKGLMRTIAFSQLGMKVAIAGDSAEVHVWDVKTTVELVQLVEHTGEITDLQRPAATGWHRPPATAGSASGAWSSTAWNVVLEGHAGLVNCIAFSPDGRLLASAGQDHTVRVWDPLTGELKWSEQQHGVPADDVGPLHLAFEATGERLASAGDDGTVIVWNTATGAVEHRLEGHTDVVRDVAFSPRGDCIAMLERGLHGPRRGSGEWRTGLRAEGPRLFGALWSHRLGQHDRVASRGPVGRHLQR